MRKQAKEYSKVDVSNLKVIDWAKKRESLQKKKSTVLKSMQGQTEKTLQGLCEGYLTIKGHVFLRIHDETSKNSNVREGNKMTREEQTTQSTLKGF